MRVVVGDVDALVAYPVCDGRGGEPHVNQKRHRAVPDVVDSDARHSRFFGSPVHLPVEIALGDGEHPVIRPDPVKHLDVILDFLGQELRHGDDPIALFRLGGGNQVLAVQPLVRLVDRSRCASRSQSLPGSGPAAPPPGCRTNRASQTRRTTAACPSSPPQISEYSSLVQNSISRFFFLPMLPGLFAGILPQVVVPHRVVEDGAELVVDRLQVHRRVGLALLILVVQHLVLPGDDLLGRDVAHFQPAEVRQQLGADDVVLGGPGVFLEPGLHIRRVEVHEAAERSCPGRRWILLSCSRSQACASRLVLKPRFWVCLRSPFQSV